ncbi:hypothetical protein BDFG_07082 [Blastomyces dermatitidis ATCC 26199]|nr:hypothetical protein BDFG_07082 [Blastomyces dermatitidis ATCC 26199]
MPRMNFNKQMIKQSFLELSLASLASGRPVPHANVPSRLRVRESPQELSHSKFLASVQESLQDTAFELLDNEAFTHVKAAGDVDGMTHSLIYRALERNTGTVGLASALCESMEAVNPEVAAITQHQDPASAGAAEINKQIALDLTVQIASIGGDLLLAIESSTFAPGNTEGDEEGCIFTENLLVPDVTEEEIISSKLVSMLRMLRRLMRLVPMMSRIKPLPQPRPPWLRPKRQLLQARLKQLLRPRRRKPSPQLPAALIKSSLAPLSLNFDLVICAGANPFIIFNNDLYLPFDSVFFRHSAVISIDVLSLFVCNTLATTCFASRAVIDACFLGRALAAAQVGLAAADILNNAFLTLSL